MSGLGFFRDDADVFEHCKMPVAGKPEAALFAQFHSLTDEAPYFMIVLYYGVVTRDPVICRRSFTFIIAMPIRNLTHVDMLVCEDRVSIVAFLGETRSKISL